MDHTHENIDADTLMKRVAQLIDQGRPGAARPLLAAARGLARPSSGLSVLAARLALSEGHFDDAERDLDRAVIAEPDHSGLRKCRAELRGRTGDLEGAVRDAAEAVVLDRDDAGAKAVLGELLLRLGRVADAVACLREAVAAAPGDVAYREMLGQSLIASGDMEAALATLLEGIGLVPGAGALRNAAILLCIRRRDFARADRIAEEARVDGVADASTFGLKGHALSGLGRHDDAALAYKDALKLAPGDAHIRHLATATTAVAPSGVAPSGVAHSDTPTGVAPATPSQSNDFIRTLFDGDADRFEAHIIELGYRIPGLIRRHVIDFAAAANIGPVLDLGCGTGLVALALSDLPIGPFTGLDVSPRMLEQARAKALYATLREARLPAALRDDTVHWRLILAADLMCYFGPLEEMLSAVRERLRPGGRFIFSVEELLPDHDGVVPGNGYWALGRLGRHAHAASHIAATADNLGFRCLALDRETLRYEAGGPVAGLIAVLERPRDDA